MHMNKKAFTLVELLVVISIIALLVSILLPALNKARDAAKFTICQTNMHQIGLAMTMYANENKGRNVPGDTAGVTIYGYDPSQNEYRFFLFGHLLGGGYLPLPEADNSVLYCPGDKVDWYRTPANDEMIRFQSDIGIQWIPDRSWESGYFNNTVPVHCSYEFRDSMDGNWRQTSDPDPATGKYRCKGAPIDRTSKHVLLSTWLAYPYMMMQHKKKYNFLVGDGHVEMLNEQQYDEGTVGQYTNADPKDSGITYWVRDSGYRLGNRWEDYLP